MSTAAEAVITLASELKAEAAALYEAYVQLPLVIEKEHRAIRSRDFPDIENAGAAKAEVCARIEKSFHAMAVAAARIGQHRARLLGGEARCPAALKECVAALEELRAAFLPTPGEGALAMGVLTHQIDGLRKLARDFEAKVREVKPLVEANRELVGKLLRDYQDSYRFWQKVSEETISAYNERGVQETSGRLSGFSASA